MEIGTVEKNQKSEDPSHLRVGSKTDVKRLAGAITATMKNFGRVSLRCIGDGAIGRGMRAATISSGHLKPIGVDLVIVSNFDITEIDGNEKTLLVLNLENR